MNGKEILELPMGPNDADAPTVRGYFVKLLDELLTKGEGFSGKRPFGNSGWEYDLYLPLIQAGAIPGKIEDGEIVEVDEPAARMALGSAVNALLQ